MLLSLIGGKIDILMISETKWDAIFPTNDERYSTVYRWDRNDTDGGKMLFVEDSIITFPLDR